MSRTPELAEVIREAIRQALLEVRVSMPCRVESYDAAAQTASVQPGFKRVDDDGTAAAFPVVPNVPVEWPRAGGAFITLPLAAGDTGRLVFCDRALDRWRDGGGGPVDPATDRAHDLVDAVFVPGLHTDGDPLPTAATDALVVGLEDGSASIRVTTAGDVSVQAGEATVEASGSAGVSGAGGSASLTLESAGATLDGLLVSLGDGADAFLVRGTEFMTWANLVAAALQTLGAAVPVPPTILSTKAKVL